MAVIDRQKGEGFLSIPKIGEMLYSFHVIAMFIQQLLVQRAPVKQSETPEVGTAALPDMPDRKKKEIDDIIAVFLMVLR